jgi:hypothetical protein
MPWSIDLHYALAGFMVGGLVGVTGVGGGSLMTPILIVLFGVSPATAVGTDLLFAAATKTVGSFVHGFNGTIEWRVVRLLATGSLPGDRAHPCRAIVAAYEYGWRSSLDYVCTQCGSFVNGFCFDRARHHLCCLRATPQ